MKSIFISKSLGLTLGQQQIDSIEWTKQIQDKKKGEIDGKTLQVVFFKEESPETTSKIVGAYTLPSMELRSEATTYGLRCRVVISASEMRGRMGSGVLVSTISIAVAAIGTSGATMSVSRRTHLGRWRGGARVGIGGFYTCLDMVMIWGRSCTLWRLRVMLLKVAM